MPQDERLTKRDLHEGKTPAAWALTFICLIGFAVGTVAVCMAQPLYFWVGVGIFVLGLIVGKVMSVMGYGQLPRGHHPKDYARQWEKEHEHSL